jgi:hypothetical protein
MNEDYKEVEKSTSFLFIDKNASFIKEIHIGCHLIVETI